MFDHACCLPPVRQTERLAICCVPIPPWVVIAGSAFSNRRCGYPALLVHFGTVRFLMAIPTENEGTGDERDAGDGERSRRWGRVRFCVIVLALRCFPRGVRWGLRAPDCAKEPLALWTLFIWVAAWVHFTRGRGFGYNGDLSGLRSFCACHTFLSGCLMFDHACCLPHERQTERLAICFVPVPPWVEIAGSAFSNRRYGYPDFLVHFGLARFFMAIPTGDEGRGDERDAGDGERSRRRGRARFCVIILALPCFPRGVRWGLRAPKPAPKSLRLSGLSSFDSRCGGVSRGEGRSSATRT